MKIKDIVMKRIIIIWLIFFVLYLTLGCLHWRVRNDKMPHVRMPTVMTVRFDKGIKIFIDEYNKKNQTQNMLSAIGYFLFATAGARTPCRSVSRVQPAGRVW